MGGRQMFTCLVETAKKANVAIRIGVNAAPLMPFYHIVQLCDQVDNIIILLSCSQSSFRMMITRLLIQYTLHKDPDLTNHQQV
jgi:4-hydroxy-3-methylbut-2-en-1-yl diphosphate synthase IspG/GcpE